jgi:hypothetical protein
MQSPEQFSVLIKHGSLRAGNLAVSQLNLNPNFSSLKKYSSKAAVLTASQDSLFNVENKQINLKPLKTAPQKSVSIKKSNLYTGTRKSIYRFKQLCSVHDKSN